MLRRGMVDEHDCRAGCAGGSLSSLRDSNFQGQTRRRRNIDKRIERTCRARVAKVLGLGEVGCSPVQPRHLLRHAPLT